MIALLATAGVCLIAVWIPAFAWDWESWVPLTATGIIVGATAIAFVVRFVLRRRRGAALEREMAAQGEHQANQASPDQRPEIIALQKQMASAVHDLKGSKLGGGGSAALYALPWYAIMGPSATGKTTLLLNSGLSFRSPSGEQRKVRGVAGTRNCDWWFSDQAILLDTAGRLATEDSDDPEWLSFLDLLKRNRPRRPLDGVIVTISSTDLLGANRSDVDVKAQKLRGRLDELMRQLEMVLPVYLLVTKTDLIAGFSEFWGNLTAQEAAQVWGATFDPSDDRLNVPEEAVKSEIDELNAIVHARIIHRLQSETSPERIARILQFPVELQGLRRPLAKFCGILFGKSEFVDTPLLRGFYLTCGVQSGSPVDRVMAGSIRGPAPAGPMNSGATRLEAPTVSHSFFLTELFRSVVFSDKGLATRSKSRMRRLMRHQVTVAVGAIALAILTAIPATFAYLANRTWIDDTETLQLASLPDPTHPRQTDGALGPLLRHSKALEAESENAFVPYWWGAYATPELAAVARTSYLLQLRSVVEGPIQAQLLQQVRSVATLEDLHDENFRTGHDYLKLYLELCTPNRLEIGWAGKELAQVWRRVEQRGVIVQGGDGARHVNEYLKELARHPDWAWKQNGTTVTQARGRLRGEQIEEISYARILKVASSAPAVRPRDIFFGASGEFITAKPNVEVPGTFTKLGWERIRAAFENDAYKITFDPWVLGYSDDARSPWSKESLRARYFTEYGRQWENFLLELDAQSPQNLSDAIRELSILGKVDGPYTRLFRRLSDNIRLSLTAPASVLGSLLESGKKLAADGAEKLTKKLGKEEIVEKKEQTSSVELHFRRLLQFSFGEEQPDPNSVDLPPSSLSQYLEELRNLEVALKQIREANLDASTFKGELQRTVSSVERLLGGLNRTERFIMDRLLIKPLRGSQGVVVGAAARDLNKLWRAQVHDRLSSMKKLYPFSSTSREEIPLADFADFFRPRTGIFWTFYGENLSTRYSESGGIFSLRPTEKKAGYVSALTNCLTDVRKVTTSIFFGSQDTPSVPFGVQIEAPGGGVAETVLAIDGQELHYRNEPVTWKNLQWPGKGTTKGALVRIRGQSGSDPFQDKFQRYGDFAFFRLLFAGQVKRANPRSVDLEASWTLHQTPVVMRFRPLTGNHPFKRNFFRRVRCPRTILIPQRSRR